MSTRAMLLVLLVVAAVVGLVLWPAAEVRDLGWPAAVGEVRGVLGDGTRAGDSAARPANKEI